MPTTRKQHIPTTPAPPIVPNCAALQVLTVTLNCAPWTQGVGAGGVCRPVPPGFAAPPYSLPFNVASPPRCIWSLTGLYPLGGSAGLATIIVRNPPGASTTWLATLSVQHPVFGTVSSSWQKIDTTGSPAGTYAAIDPCNVPATITITIP